MTWLLVHRPQPFPNTYHRSIQLRDGPGADGSAAYFAYSTNYLVEWDNAVIVDVELIAPIRPTEARAAKNMIDRVHDCFGIKLGKLVGDTRYGSAEMLRRLFKYSNLPVKR